MQNSISHDDVCRLRRVFYEAALVGTPDQPESQQQDLRIIKWLNHALRIALTGDIAPVPEKQFTDLVIDYQGRVAERTL